MAELIPIATGTNRRAGAVVFIHGLSGHPTTTWGATDTSRDLFWPEWLSDDPELADLAFYTVAYEADSSERLGRAMSLFDHGENVLAMLLGEPDLLDAPIALVAHSLGGLVIKQVMREAYDQRERNPQARRFLERIAQVVFIATPHQGSRLPVLIERWGWFAWRPTIVMKNLRDGDEGLLKLKRWYTNFCGLEKPDLRHLVFRETQRTNRFMVVSEASADPGVPAEQIPIATDHLQICKPASRASEVYGRIRDFLGELSLAASPAAFGRGLSNTSTRRSGAWRPRILHREVRDVADLAHRPDMTATLDAAFDRAPDRPIALINSTQVTRSVAGMAGVGKTELARAFAWRHRDSYSGVWWIASETREGIWQDLAELGERLDQSIGAMARTEAAAEATVRLLEASTAEEPFLLVYDNVASPPDLDGLVPRSQCHVIITSRWTDWFGTAEKLDVGLFTPEQSIEHLTRAAADDDREGAARLADALGHLPLAIDHAAAYRRSRRVDSFDDYRERLEELIHERSGPRARANLYPTSVHRTFTLALQRTMDGGHPDAETAVSLAAFLAPEAIPTALIELDGASETARTAALAALAEVSLITLATTETGEPTFSIHRLLQLVVQDRLEETGTYREALSSAVRTIDAAVPRTAYDYAQWPATKPLVAHARAVLGHARQHGLVEESVARLAIKLAQYLIATGQFTDAEDLLRFGMQLYEKLHGPDSNAVGVAAMSLALLFENQGRWSEAEPLLRRDLVITEKTLGRAHPQYATTLDHLATTYLSCGRTADVEPLLEEALRIREDTLGVDHPDTVAVLGTLASHLIAQCRYAAAEPLLTRALEVTRNVEGEEHPDTASASGRLGELYLLQGRYREAEPLLQRDLTITEGVLGAHNHETAACLANLAQLRLTCGAYDAAEPLYERALRLREQAFGRSSPLTATSLHGLGWLRANQGRYADAERLYLRALHIREASLGDDHASTAATASALARLHVDQGRYEEAHSLFRRDLDLALRTLGKQHPDTAASMTSIARLHVIEGRYTTAEPLYLAALKTRETVLGADHPATASTLSGLAGLRAHQRSYREAAALYDRALDVRTRKLGPDHPWVARTLNGMADLALREAQMQRAEDLASRALATRRKRLPAGHPDIAQSLWTLAVLRLNQGQNWAARIMLKEALAILEPRVRPDHIWLRGVRAGLHGVQQAA